MPNKQPPNFDTKSIPLDTSQPTFDPQTNKKQAPNAFERLRKQRLLNSSKPFQARGASVVRCDDCYLSSEACICSWRKSMACGIDIALLMHNKEILKPTNTGRLIADCFPKQCHAFEWARTEPSEELLTFIADPTRFCFILFPGELVPERQVYQNPQPEELAALCGDKTPTVILLDGTWKQARKMLYQSEWLQTPPILSISPEHTANYALRKAPKEHQLSTAEAGVMVLNAFGETKQARLLNQYFELFNHHYRAIRRTMSPELNDIHQRMEAL